MALNKLTTKMTEQEARATQNQNNLHLLASEGTIDEQTIFDELAKKTSESSGAELIGVSPIDGIEGDTAQAVLGSINTQLSQKAPLTALSAAISAHNSDITAHNNIRLKKKNMTFYQPYQTKNVLNAEDGNYYTSANRIRVTVDNNIFTVTRMTETVYNGDTIIGGTFTPPESGIYTIRAYGTVPISKASAVSVHLRNLTDSVNLGYVFTGETSVSKTYTLDSDKEYCYKIGFTKKTFDAIFPNIGDSTSFKVQLEKGDKATDWVNPVVYEIPEIKELQKTTVKMPDETNPLSKFIEGAGMAGVFKSFACIGDSLTYGLFERTNGTTLDRANTEWYSYPSVLKRLTGADVYNLGVSGATAVNSATAISNGYSWINSANNNNWFSADYNAVAYIIQLGTNDIGYFGGFTGETTDINVDDMTATDTTTSVGGYGYIIQRILQQQPKAKIFCVCLPNTRNSIATRPAANAKIKDIAALFPDNCYVIDLETYGVSVDSVAAFKAKYYNGGHLNAMGYNYHTHQLCTYIDWIVRNNAADFDNIQFVGTANEYVKS